MLLHSILIFGNVTNETIKNATITKMVFRLKLFNFYYQSGTFSLLFCSYHYKLPPLNHQFYFTCLQSCRVDLQYLLPYFLVNSIFLLACQTVLKTNRMTNILFKCYTCITKRKHHNLMNSSSKSNKTRCVRLINCCWWWKMKNIF